MIRSPLTHRALAIAHMAHAHQTDKAGAPYMEHVLYVAEQMPDEVSTAVALLHDVLEDSPQFDANTLIRYGITAEVVEHVMVLTRMEGQSYGDYIDSLKDDPIARRVKLVDLHHNSDLTRYEVIPLEAYSLRERYAKAIQVLEAA